jgi:hypothetical protein
MAMPKISRLFVLTALAYLALAMLAGIALASLGAGDGGLGVSGTGSLGSVALLRPAWIHLITVGWLTQLIFGVALWLFPRPGGHSDTQGAELWLCYGALNAGLLLRVASEAGPALGFSVTVLPLSATLQLVAVLVFVFHAWPRVREG